MNTVVLKTSKLALLLAGLACLSFVSGQEPNAPAVKSLESLRVRAEAGDAAAQYSLSSMYRPGQGVPQDYVQAHRWMNVAASGVNGYRQAEYLNSRDALTGEMTPAQIAEAQRLAREWKPKAEQESKEPTQK